MKIKSNDPIWKDVYSQSKLPASLEGLKEMSTNLWWVWNHEGAKLFGKIDPALWKKTEGNPVQLLQNLSFQRTEEILADKELMAEITKVYADFKAYMNVKPDQTKPSVAYFSMEYGLTNVLKIYSGGLGVLAGDYLKEASDSNVDMCAVGFLYRYGYFTQTLSMDGQQIANYEAQNFNSLPLVQVMEENDEPMVLEVPYPGRTVYAHIWKVSVGRVPLYLMDTDIPQNSEWDRSITHQLYGGDWENRMKQEYLLGIGGIMMLNKLGIKKQIYHCNEGHAALINAQRLVDYIQKEGLSFNQALEVVRASSLYTVHTPVPAGHDYFDEGLFGRYMGELLSYCLDDAWNIGKVEFTSIDISTILADNSDNLDGVCDLLKAKINADITTDDAIWVKALAETIASRSARLVVATYCGIMWHLYPNGGIPKQFVAVDGSVYEKMPTIKDNMQKAIYEILGEEADKLEFVLENGGSALGAALAAAMEPVEC